MVNRGDDQTDRLIDEGIWEHDFDDNSRVLAQLGLMLTGERIAIKATYIKKHGLPFETWAMAAASACEVDLVAKRVTFSQTQANRPRSVPLTTFGIHTCASRLASKGVNQWESKADASTDRVFGPGSASVCTF